MYRKLMHILIVLGGLAAFPPSSSAGIILLNNDEWTLSNTGFSQNLNTTQFVQNVASLFSGGGPGNFLAYSSNFGLTQSTLATTMANAGHTWTVSTGTPFTLANLQTYDGIFLGGNPHSYDATVLTNYVNSGGNVYLMGGTGFFSSAAAEAAAWNPFLNNFGLGFGTTYNGVSGNLGTVSPHPVLSGVSSLYFNNGNDTLDLNVSDPQSQILASSNGHGLLAIYESAAVPEPSSLTLFLGGLSLLFGGRLSVRRGRTSKAI
jgi:hypothetical protein